MISRHPDSLQTYSSLLHRSGWDPTALRLKKRLALSLPGGGEPTQGRLLGLYHEGELAASLAILEGVRFPSGLTLYQRFLDMTLEARLCLRAAAAIAPAPYAFIATPYECYLYDTKAEELILSATSPEESAARLFRPFTPDAYAEGAMERFPRRSPQQWGRELADWLRVWAAKLGRTARIPPDTLRLLQSHWLIAWRDAVSSRPGKGADPLGATVHGAEDPALCQAGPVLPGPFHSTHIQMQRQRFPLGIFGANAGREALFWNDEAMASALGEFLAEARLLSRSKFNADQVLFAFTDEETERKSWITALTQQPRAGERLARHEFTIYDPIVADIRESGYGWALALFEDLTRYWIAENIKRQEQSRRQGPIGVQMDFLAPAPSGLHASGYMEDILLFILTHAYRLHVRSADERLLAGLLVALKAIELSETYGLPLTRFTDIDGVFEG